MTVSGPVFRTVLGAGALACALVSAPAQAQQYLYGASGSLSSGIQGGSAGGSGLTRMRVRVGADLRVDEFPDDIVEFGALAEIAPRSGFGADARYARMVGERFVVDAGILGILAPSSLYGACAGVTYRLPFGKHFQVTLGPEADFYFLGSDLPDGTVIWELRISGGLRVDL